MTALLIATIGCVAANAYIAVADYVRAEFVLKNSAAVNVSARALPYLGTLKLAGAAGLVVGMIALPWLGLAAAVGLVLFFVGASIVHVRAGLDHTIVAPGIYLVLAIASAVYMARLATG